MRQSEFEARVVRLIEADDGKEAYAVAGDGITVTWAFDPHSRVRLLPSTVREFGQYRQDRDGNGSHRVAFAVCVSYEGQRAWYKIATLIWHHRSAIPAGGGYVDPTPEREWVEVLAHGLRDYGEVHLALDQIPRG